MNFLTILLIVFCGGTFWVRANFFVEIKDWTAARVVKATYLYECRGVPQGTLAIRATQSWCTPVYAYEQKTKIHAIGNFYRLFEPELQGHEIYLSDRGLLEHNEWSLGFSNNPIDHPNFGPPSQLDFGHFSDRVAEMGGEPIVEPDEVNTLIRYFSKANVISYFGDPPLAYSQITTFSTVLQRIINEHDTISQIRNQAAAEQVRNRVRAAMKVGLRKMIDPCSFYQGVFLQSASMPCEIYCDFLNIAAIHFGPISNRCTSLVGGLCQGAICTCLRVSTSPVTGCQNSPMRMCHNKLRVKLDL